MLAKPLLPRPPASLALLAAVGLAMVAVSGLEAKPYAFMSSDEVRPGMRGKGITVFQGTKRDEFDVEILGVMKNTWPKGDMILARLDGGPLVGSGLISGMSGSPIYVEGKLLGAVAYGWGFAKQPLCGITPIRQMLADSGTGGAKPGAHPGAPAGSWSSWDLRRALGWPVEQSLPIPFLRGFGRPNPTRHASRFPRPPETPARSFRGVPGDLRPIATPVMISSVDTRLLTAMRPFFDRFNMVPVQAGSVSPAKGLDVELRPGSAVGIQLIGGDMDMTAVGTVTYRDGDHILAFGHPFVSAGPVQLPMSAAYVHTVVSSSRWSFKLAGGTRVVGRFEQDRPFAMSGRIGKFAPTIPCEVTVTRDQGRRTFNYRYSLVNHKSWSGYLAMIAIASSLFRTEKMEGDMMVEVDMRVGVADRPLPVHVRNQFFNDGWLIWQLMDLGSYVQILQNNPFATATLKSISLKINVSQVRRTASIKSVRVERMFVKPGHKVTVTALLKPFQAPKPIPRRFEFTVPRYVRPGTPITITISNSWTSMMIEYSRAPGKFRPETFEQLVALIERQEPNKNLVLRAAIPEIGLTTHGAAMPDLPGSVLSILANATQTGAEPMLGEIVQRMPTEWIIYGGQAITIFVDKED